MTKDTHDSVLRFAPPLIVTEIGSEWAAEVIEDALADLAPAFPETPMTEKLDRLVLEARRAADKRAEGYREKALKTLPLDLRPLRPGVHLHQPARAHRPSSRPQSRQQPARRQQLGAAMPLLPRQRAPAQLEATCGQVAAKQPAKAATHSPFSGLGDLFKKN
jgi:hypothetical protein